MTRDPRKDPQAGDVLIRRKGAPETTVQGRNDETVSYTEGRWGGIMKLGYWRETAKTAQVIHTAGEG